MKIPVRWGPSPFSPRRPPLDDANEANRRVRASALAESPGSPSLRFGGIDFRPLLVDRSAVLWPTAVLVILILGFAVVYGSVVQARVEGARDPKD